MNKQLEEKIIQDYWNSEVDADDSMALFKTIPPSLLNWLVPYVVELARASTLQPCPDGCCSFERDLTPEEILAKVWEDIK